MRNLLTIIILAAVGYFGINAFFGGDDTPDSDPGAAVDRKITGRVQGGADPTDSVSSAGILGVEPAESIRLDEPGNLDEAAIARANAKVDEARPAPAAGEIGALEKALRGVESTEKDAERLRLATLYRRANRLSDADEQYGIVFRGGGSLAPQAAAALLERSSGDSQLEYAAYVLERGPEATGYGVAALIRGKTFAASSEEADQIQAWRLLSDAYFSRPEESWRAPIRQLLEPIAERWLLSRRPSSLTRSYTVQGGDFLARIAQDHDSTVDQLRALNAIESDLIHPGDRLKILDREIEVEVDKSEFRLDVRYDGGFLMSFPVGHGAEGRTPTTTFKVNLRQEHPTWFPANRPSVLYGDPGNPLGERWLGFAETEGLKGFGIHGTNQPDTIGTEASEGCVRLRNEDVIRLYPFIALGTKVTIRD